MKKMERDTQNLPQELRKHRKENDEIVSLCLYSKMSHELHQNGVLSILFLPSLFIYLELAFHLLIFQKLDGYIVYAVITAMIAGLIANVVTSLWKTWMNKVFVISITFISCLWFCAQLVFHHIFRTFLSLYSVGENGTDVLEFWKDALQGTLDNLFGIFVLFLPVFVLIVLYLTKTLKHKRGIYIAGLQTISALALYGIFLVLLLLPGRLPHTPYDLYHKDFVSDLGIEKVGLLTATRFDFNNVLFGPRDFQLEEAAFAPADILEDVSAVKKEDVPFLTQEESIPATENEFNSSSEPSESAEVSLIPTKEPVDNSPNILQIDFNDLAIKENSKAIKNLHQYFSSVIPTNKNEYTGIFEGYNLIFLTAEGFSPWAVDATVTPTLYELTHSGFVFKNFYTPIWWTSTSDGEFVACTGLIPNGTNSFTKTAKCDMPFCLGWQFKERSYSTRAYHNHSYKYYNRNLTHPNMGYDYQGAKGGGLEVKLTWPESDLEMIQETLPEYINDEKFHTYYMTVSGHMEYTFSGNTMSSKNKKYVENLPYSDACKAYLACNKELDLALEYLISSLRDEGVLDQTVIVLSADHYPYGLNMEEINEFAGHEVEQDFELYKNHLILWNSKIKEPIVIDKYCSSLDIMPTVMNLFGIPYDSRLFLGQDILSDAPALVMMSNQSFITEHMMYHSKTGEVERLDEAVLPENYLETYIKLVKNKFSVSGSIVKNNYFHSLLDHLHLEKYKR